jgi:hypothetical protein
LPQQKSCQCARSRLFSIRATKYLSN